MGSSASVQLSEPTSYEQLLSVVDQVDTMMYPARNRARLEEQGAARMVHFKHGAEFERCLGMSQENTSAVRCYQRAAELGLDAAQFRLGDMYAWGQGVKIDYYASVRWFQMAAEQGHAGAQYNLGHVYFEGRGVQRNTETAERWFKRAAIQGHEQAADAADAIANLSPRASSALRRASHRASITSKLNRTFVSNFDIAQLA